MATGELLIIKAEAPTCLGEAGQAVNSRSLLTYHLVGVIIYMQVYHLFSPHPSFPSLNYCLIFFRGM